MRASAATARRVGLVALLWAGALHAQVGSSSMGEDWKEEQAPAPPPLSTRNLIPIEVPNSLLRFGVDAASLAIGKDAIVRYVVVTRNPDGGVAGIHEALNCKLAQVKVYAHHNPDGGWTSVRQPRWVDLFQGMHARYSLALARAGVCDGTTPNRSVDQIVRDLGGSTIQRFNPPGSPGSAR